MSCLFFSLDDSADFRFLSFRCCCLDTKISDEKEEEVEWSSSDEVKEDVSEEDDIDFL